MNTNQLYQLLWNDSTASSYVMAIIPSNALRYVRADRCERCYIVNCNENSYLRGDIGHCMVLTIHGDRDEDVKLKKKKKNEEPSLVEVFDSLGERTYNTEMNAFMSKFKCCRVYSKHLSSTHCGYYVLLYAYYRSRKYSSSCTINILSEISDVKSHCLRLYST